MRRTMLTLALAAGLLIPAGHALAAPNNAKDAFVLPVSCTTSMGTVDLLVVTNTGQAGQHGQGTALPDNPAFIISGGTGKIITTSLTITFTGPGFSQTVTHIKGNAQGPAIGIPVSCTFSQTQGAFSFSGTATGYWIAH